MAAPAMNLQNDEDRLIDSTADSTPVVRLPIKPNNVQVLLDPNTYLKEYRIMIEFLQYHILNRALTLTNPNVPEIYVQEVWQTLFIQDEETLIGSFGHPIDTENAIQIPITRKKIARFFQLPASTIINEQGEQIPNPELEANPSVEALLAFVKFLGYNEPLTKLSEFKRKKLPPMWNVLVSILNKSLTCKIGSLDQASRNILTMMYGMYFNKPLDFAGLLFQEIKAAVHHKVLLQHGDKPLPALMFPRFLSLFTYPAVNHLKAPFIQPFCKISTMNQHRPTIDRDGYPAQRELSRYMLNLILPTSENLSIYRSSMVLSEQRIPTPEHLEPNIESEGSSENEVEKNSSEHLSEL